MELTVTDEKLIKKTDLFMKPEIYILQNDIYLNYIQDVNFKQIVIKLKTKSLKYFFSDKQIQFRYKNMVVIFHIEKLITPKIICKIVSISIN